MMKQKQLMTTSKDASKNKDKKGVKDEGEIEDADFEVVD